MTENKNAATRSTTEGKPKTIYELFAEVKREIGPVGKDGVNKSQHYNFRGIDAVVNAAAPHLDKAGVLTVPMLQTIDYSTVEVGQNRTPMGHVRVTVIYRFTGPEGDSFDALVPGEAMDSGDKATAKAMSVAYRIALLQALNLPTSDVDPDSQSYERSPARERQDPGSWEKATPAAPRGQQRQEADPAQWETAPATAQPNGHSPVPDGEVDEEAQEIANLAHEARTLTTLSALHAKAHDAGKLSAIIVSPAKGGKGNLGRYLNWCRGQIQAQVKAIAELEKAAKTAGIDPQGELDDVFKQEAGVGIEEATLAQIKQVAATLANAAGAPA